MRTNAIFRFLSPPQFDNEETQRIASVIYGLSLSIGLATAIGYIGVFFVFEEKFISSIALGILFIMGLTAHTLSKYEYIGAAGIIFLTIIWLTTTALIASSGGMQSLDIIFYITGTVVAGLLQGQRGTLFYGGASILMGIVFLVLDNAGITFPTLFTFSAQTGMILLLINLVILIPALNTTLTTLHHAIDQSNQRLEEQAQTQQDLRFSEEKFSKAFHASPMAIIIQRVKDRRYTEINEGFTRITGYSRQDVLEHTPNELNLYPDQAASKKLREQFLANGYIRDFEIPFRKKNGETGTALVWGETIDINNEKMAIAGTIDISDRKNLETLQAEQTKEMAALYEALSEITTIHGNIKHLSKQITDLIVNKFQATKCSLWLLSDDEQTLTRVAYSGKNIIEHINDIPVDSRGLITYSLKSQKSMYEPDVSGNPNFMMVDQSTRSEFVVPLQAYKDVIGVINMESPNLDGFQDRTRRLVEAFAQNATLAIQNAKLVDSLETSIADLKETQSRINFFLEHTAEGVYRIDYDPPIPTQLPFEEQFRLSVEHGKIAECNDAIAHMYGFRSREEMLGTPYIDLYGEEGLDANLEVNLDFYHQGYQIHDVETEEYNIKGEKVYFLNNVVGIIRDDHFVATWGTQRDITPLKKAIAELEQRNAELERFTYTLSHELKSPIVSIRGFLGLLKMDISSGNKERIWGDFDRITNAADKMYLMISELIELFRVGRLVNPPENVPFDEIALAGLNNVRASLKELNAQIHIQPDMPTVHVDLTRMTEVVQNLIENAIKNMGDQSDPQVNIGVREGGYEQIFFVSDNGIGIEPNFQERVFNIFEKLNPQSDGTGIGLAIVKRIIEIHEGRIWIESEGNGKGSTFCFTLPKAKL